MSSSSNWVTDSQEEDEGEGDGVPELLGVDEIEGIVLVAVTVAVADPLGAVTELVGVGVVETGDSEEDLVPVGLTVTVLTTLEDGVHVEVPV
jgi:hypothetical protein